MTLISDYNEAIVRQVETLRQQLTESASALFVGRTVRWEQQQGKVIEALWLFDAQGLYFRVRQQDEAEVTVCATRCTLTDSNKEGTP